MSNQKYTTQAEDERKPVRMPEDRDLADAMIREITENAETPVEHQKWNKLQFISKNNELWTYLGHYAGRQPFAPRLCQVYEVDRQYLATIKNKTHVLCKAVGLDDGVDELGEKRQRA